MDLRIQTLGRFAVFLDGLDLKPILDQPVRAALLLYLAVEGQGTRDGAEGVIWGDLSPERARHALNQTLYRLRRDLWEDWLSADGERLAVAPGVRVDAREFEEAVAEGAWERALLLYQGAFLEGWRLLGTPSFEHWTDRHRLHLSRLHREASRARIEMLRGAGDLDGALDVAAGWVRKDPFEDEAHHAHIQLLAAGGRRADALESYEAYVRLLARDGLEPLDDTKALVGAIRAGMAPLAGRAPESHGGSEVDALRGDRPLEPGALGGDKAVFHGESLPEGPGAGAGGGSVGNSRGPGRGRRTAAWGLAVTGVLVAAAALLFGFPRWEEIPPEWPATRVLVVPLENRTGDASLDPVGRLAADWITQGLAGTEFLQVVPSGELLAGFEVRGGGGKEGEDRPGGGAAPDHLSRALAAASENGAGTLVTGAYYLSGSGVELHAQVMEVPGRRVLESVGPIRTASMDVMEAVDVLRQRVVVSIALLLDESLGGALAESAIPPSYSAYMAFIEGAQRLAIGDWGGSIPPFTRAHEISPDFVAPLIFAGFAHIAATRDYESADSLARIVEASRETLPRYDRLRLDILQAELRGDTPAGYRAALEAATITPGGTAHFNAASKALDLNRPLEALEILGTFDPDRDFARQWTPYWNVVTQALHLLGDHREELEAARRGRRMVPDRIETVAYEARALVGLGRTREVERLLEEMVGFRSSPLMNPGQAMLLASMELGAHGFPEDAESAAARALSWCNGVSEERRNSEEMRALRAWALYQKGDWEGVGTEASELLAAHPDDPDYLGLMGASAARRGDTAVALRHSEALAALRVPYLFGAHTLARCGIAALLGDRREAMELLRASVSEGLVFGTTLHAHPYLQPLRGYPPFEDFLQPRG